MKTRYVCTSCQWKFYRNFQPSICPYCGKPTIQEYEEIPVEKIIKEI